MGVVSEKLKDVIQRDRDSETSLVLKHITPLVFALYNHGIETNPSCITRTDKKSYPWIGLDPCQEHVGEKYVQLHKHIIAYDNRPPLEWQVTANPFWTLRIIGENYDESSLVAELRAAPREVGVDIQEAWLREHRPDAATLQLMQREVERLAWDLDKIYRRQGPWFS